MFQKKLFVSKESDTRKKYITKIYSDSCEESGDSLRAFLNEISYLPTLFLVGPQGTDKITITYGGDQWVLVSESIVEET